MSTLQDSGPWSLSDKHLESKYEKCRNITEEIYKRINITFQIKKLEAAQTDVSEHSDLIDSNELSNETDLFACDKTDTISSSTDDKPGATCEKYINLNNNEEMKKKQDVTYKRPRKRFRKRVKKSQSKTRSDSDASSDEAPLSRIVELDAKCVKANQVEPHSVMGVPNIVIVANLKPKLYTPEKKQLKNTEKLSKTIDTPKIEEIKPIDKSEVTHLSMKVEKSGNTESKQCTMCSLSFRGERGLRRHMAMSHIVDTLSKTEQRLAKTT